MVDVVSRVVIFAVVVDVLVDVVVTNSQFVILYFRTLL